MPGAEQSRGERHAERQRLVRTSWSAVVTSLSRSLVLSFVASAQIFEKWRVVDTPALTGDRLAEFERDREESNRRYDYAFQVRACACACACAFACARVLVLQ